MSAHTNNRASLLAGLRTGGVRSASLNAPHTAAPGATFNVPRFHPHEEQDDLISELPSHNIYPTRAIPLTAAVDGPNNSFAHHQQTLSQNGINPNSIPFTPAYPTQMLVHPQLAHNHALQMQFQLEMIKMQALQAQQQQAELVSQQLHQQQQQASRNRRLSFNPPASAGPMNNSFDLRAAAISAQMRRTNQTEQLRSQLGVPSDDQVPMTAALGGRFGSRTVSVNVVPNLSRFSEEPSDYAPPPTPSSTTVISGGTSLGSHSANTNNHYNAPSKSDSVSSWRRGGNNNSVLSGNNRPVSSPSVKITPPPPEGQRVSPPPASSPTSTSGPRFRPQPLRFSVAASQPLPSVVVDGNTEDDTDADTHSSSSGASNSSPTTPRSSASSNESSLSPREEASKKLYEGLGIGRPVSTVVSDQVRQQHPSADVAPHRMVSQPMRQPRGPPSGADELGPKNFASRIRRKAIGGLEVLMGARERREVVEAY